MIIVAEKINATLKEPRRIIQERDENALLELARNQAQAGAGYLDVNVGTGSGDAASEAEAMRWAVETIQAKVDTPLCIDSADPDILKAGLEARDGRPAMINSSKAEDKSLATIAPLAAEFKAPLVGLAMDEKGIPKTVDERLAAGRKLVEACRDLGMPDQDIFLDPLVLPVSTDIKQGMVTLDTLAAFKENFPEVKSVMGLSNISFGLPGRAGINAAFLHMAIYAGLDSAIGNPMDQKFMTAVREAEVLAGKDRHCRRYTRFMRNS
jgi:5-methyltetrahydrofolate corrinoid/iron sulfur protein methyltransferase